MTKSAFFKTGALGALATALLASALPAQAQGVSRGSHQHASRAHSREDRAQSPRQSRPTATARSDWRGGGDQLRESARGQAYAQQAANPQARAEARVEAPTRNATYTAARDRSYGLNSRSRSWQGEQLSRESAAQTQRPVARNEAYSHSGSRYNNRRDDNAGRADWHQGGQVQARNDGRYVYRGGYRDGRHSDGRYDNDNRRGYGQGYRDGRRADNRYGSDYRRWDNRGWRNDNRYDWYRYRASNRSLFRLGRYYAPYRGYSYSRLGIGFRLESLFYSSRYWINDPWQYRLPDVYGPYRWIRYYNDALMVDIYSGEVVDSINNFFW